MKSNESDNFRSNPEGGKLTSGEPDAVKVARPVRRREWRNVLKSNALCSYPTLNYLISIRDSVKNGIGLMDNRHLNYFVESINMNVGGFYQDVKVSSPPRIDRSVGGVIVVGTRESRVQGEGRQEVNIFLVER